MKRVAMVGAAVLCGGAAPAPVADYWMDVATTSGFGAGMSAQPSMAQVMNMMNGGGSAVGRTIDLRLASRQKAAAGAQADHLIPPGLQMGASLPLLTPAVTKAETYTPGLPANYQPKGRMLIYWGCGEHVSAGQPTVIDYAKMTAGKVPAGMAAMASSARYVSAPGSAAGFGRWPNDRDSREVPAAGSLLGGHKVQASYAPPIAFSLAAGQDFMPGLGLREAGALPSGASRLTWQPSSQATGYALAMFGAGQNGDMIMWSSATKAQMAMLDYLAPAEVKRQIASGTVLAPSTSQCVLPAEVAAAVPTGMVTMIGYGPEAHFSDMPKAPKWTARVRYKTTASLMRGMSEMMGAATAGDDRPPQQRMQQPQPPQKKKKRSLLGDIIQGATGIPIPDDQ
jgi:hypothetical protein